MERPNFTFRQAQSAFDLIWLLQSVDNARLINLGGEALLNVVHGSACRFGHDTDVGCYEAIASAVLDGTEDAELAVALLVANNLQTGRWSGDTKEFAEVAVENVAMAHSRLRTAILRGLDTLEDTAIRYEPAEYLLPKESRLTLPRDEVLPRLCDLARSVDQATCNSIAAADYGQDTARHLEALRDVLSKEDCQFPNNDVWYPSEVVELVAHVRSTPGFVPCTALLLANALPTNDEMGWFDFRWHTLAADYNALPDSARAPILAGMRYLYEADAEFMPYEGKKFYDPVLSTERMIHFEGYPEAAICA
jgi:hypothetical protein